MNKLTLFVLSALLLQLSLADRADDAEDALNGLRQTISDNLNGGFLEHTKMSIEVDQIALDTKEAGRKAIKEKTQELLGRFRSFKVSPVKALQYRRTVAQFAKVAADSLEDCVNKHASEAIDVIYSKSSGLTNKALEQIYTEEKSLVICGRADEDCLSGVINEIGAIEEQIPGVVNDEIEADRKEVEMHIEGIKGCTDATIQKAQIIYKL